ncbi:CDP-diacylglycerol--glycerol-3-phosphate 3-phosphatidyltransferase [Magnetococcus marinus MC-1]|uniref:CDP-diacylglycerol--glycerol-3-phosphate 3-phosphatidyltransferase n=1 Tax=Magnetococcus marinus (strain ATCC BAA-1437 / JCM 17883 / MC-1) TaxID=156889 RepID=A0L8U3_MAGMM|nr:CDP-diacylglycerol--glycerol-3-phosphate 3-phosphatidyltransferase [Magnetococcus marinus]ABK44386.1 CDP-diacylglycerol--glycerol-3-phosphate 3-phosphatidyltransferase [Magnetococcus marinus MC-1]
MNLPNKLTVSRIVFIPFFIVTVYLSGRMGHLLSAGIFVLAAVTDWLDGYLARSRGQMTPFGKFLDPVADKLLVIAALMVLLAEQRIDIVVVLVLVAREIVVMALREFMAGKGGGVPVSQVGKWKTGVQMVAITMLLLGDALFGLPLQPVGLLLLYISALLAVWSAFLYVRSVWSHIIEGAV